MNHHPDTSGLVPFDRLPPDVQRERARAGGIASGKVRRQQAEARDAVRKMLWSLAAQSDMKKEFTDALEAYQRQIERRSRRRKQS